MPKRYIRQGECRRWCGTACCSLEGYRNNPEFEEIKKDFLEHPEFFGLNERGECNKLGYKNGVPFCKVYDDRPQICKDFPIHPRDIYGLPECGFSFIKKPDPIVHPQPPNPYVLMGFKEEWPLFSVKKHVYPESHEVFVEIDEVPPLKTIGHMRAMQAEVRRLEWKCWQGGMTGWMIGAEPQALSVQGCAVTWGGSYFAQHEGFLWFSKRITKAPRVPVPSMAELKTGIQTYMRTMRAAYAHH